MYSEILDLTYDLYIKMIQEETLESIPVSIQIDEWKSQYYEFKVLGVTAYYINEKFESCHKCLGLIKLNNEDAVTIRRCTDRSVTNFFGENFSFIVCHDTCSTMNCSYRIDLKIENKKDHLESNESQEDDIEMEIEDEEISPMNSVPNSIIESLKPRIVFKDIKNVEICHEKCHVHVFDLFIKKSIDNTKKG